MKIKTRFGLMLLGLAFWSFHSAVLAQVAFEKTPPQLVETPPAHGTFYLLGRIPSPPFPFDPYHGALPVYAYDGVLFVDDSAVSWLAQEFSFAAFGGEGEGGGMMMAMSGPGLPGGFTGGGGGSSNLVCNSLTNFTVDYLYATNGLTLRIAQTTNPWIALTIQTDSTNAPYDVFGTTNMVELALPSLGRTNWVHRARINGGITNFHWGLTDWCERYFQLGTTNDLDADGLTTAFEFLVSHTGTNTWDTDGDGIGDGAEVFFGLNPRVGDPAFTITITQPTPGILP